MVTGATGFLGGQVLTKLTEEFGREFVLGTGRNAEKAKELVNAGNQVVTGDLTDAGFIKNSFSDITHIIHCAAKSSLWGSYESFYQANVVTTLNLLYNTPLAQRFVYISTPSIYFRFSDKLQIKEDAALPKKFVNHYTATKYLAEREVLNFKNESLVRVVLRPRAIIGAGDTSIVPRVIRAYKAGRLRIIGPGNNICDFTSVKNIAHAIYLSILSNNDINGKVFNLTDDQPVAVWQLVDSTLKALGYQPRLKKISYGLVFTIALASEVMHRMFRLGEPVLTRYGVGLLRYSQTLDISLAKELLGYQPVTSTEASIGEFIDSFINAK